MQRVPAVPEGSEMEWGDAAREIGLFLTYEPRCRISPSLCLFISVAVLSSVGKSKIC